MDVDIEEGLNLILTSPNYQHEYESLGATLLHYSARHGMVDKIPYLLQKGYNVNAKDSRKRTPLMMGVEGKDEQVIKALLAAGANILDVDYEGRSALSMLCADHTVTITLNELFLKEFRKQCSDSQDCAVKLIDAGCHLFQAAFIEDAKIIEYMLEQGLPSNSMHPVGNLTALHIAINADDLESIKLLLKHGADAHVVNILGYNSFHYFHSYRLNGSVEKIEILKILLDLGVSATSCNDDGTFQMRSVLEYGDKNAISLILQSKIDFTATDSEESNILHYIANNSNPGIAEALKPHLDKFDVNEVNEHGLTPIHSAAFYGNVEMMTLLLHKGARTNGKTSPNGYTPLYYACSESTPENKIQYDQCIELLLQHYADPQFLCTNKSGEQVTVFDITNIDMNTIKLVIAQLALLEGLGVTVTKITSDKINSQDTYKDYFHLCRRIIKQNISGSVTLMKLLSTSSDRRKMAQYLGNKDLVLKLKRIHRKPDIKFSLLYYYNTVKKYYSEGMKFRRLKNVAARVLVEIFEGRYSERNLVIEKVIDLLKSKSLNQLRRLKKLM